MTIYRIPSFQESVRCYQFYAPHEGDVWVLESENGGSIARAFSKYDFRRLIEKYSLRVEPNHAPL